MSLLETMTYHPKTISCTNNRIYNQLINQETKDSEQSPKKLTVDDVIRFVESNPVGNSHLISENEKHRLYLDRAVTGKEMLRLYNISGEFVYTVFTYDMEGIQEILHIYHATN